MHLGEHQYDYDFRKDAGTDPDVPDWSECTTADIAPTFGVIADSTAGDNLYIIIGEGVCLPTMAVVLAVLYSAMEATVVQHTSKLMINSRVVSDLKRLVLSHVVQTAPPASPGAPRYYQNTR